MKRALGLLCVMWLLASAGAARAETDTIRVGMQYGLPYMQLVLMQGRDFIGPRAKEAGIPLKAEFVTMGGPAVLNDSVISGALDVGAVGMSNLVTMWSKTRTSAMAIRGLSGMNIMPLLLVAKDPRITALKDYGPNDKIVVPSVKVSMQAIMLEILASKAFGEANYTRLDPNTISMGHPDAANGLMAGGGAFSSHFSSLPYQHIELASPGIHLVASSFDAIGPHSVSALAATARFRTQNPKVVAVFLQALQDATDFINEHRKEAAELYLSVTHDKTTPDELVAMMGDKGVEFTLRPQGAGATAAFMAKAGIIKEGPANWHDMYFDTVAAGGGS